MWAAKVKVTVCSLQSLKDTGEPLGPLPETCPWMCYSCGSIPGARTRPWDTVLGEDFAGKWPCSGGPMVSRPILTASWPSFRRGSVPVCVQCIGQGLTLV